MVVFIQKQNIYINTFIRIKSKQIAKGLLKFSLYVNGTMKCRPV